MGSAPLVTQSGSLTSYVACLILCKIILWDFLSHSVHNIFHKIVLQFYVLFYLFTPMWLVLFSLLCSQVQLCNPVVDKLA
jgi:hypothetical protein